jgi:hypothetical protein
VVLLSFLLPPAEADTPGAVTLDQVLRGAELAEQTFHEKLQDYTCQATTTFSELHGDGSPKTVRVIEKTIYRKLPDLRRERYRSVTEGDKVLSPREVAEHEKKQKWDRSTGSRSFFHPDRRQQYLYQLLSPNTVGGIPVHTIQLTARRKEDGLFNGTVWLHQENYEVVQLDIRPARYPRFVKEIHIVIGFDEVQPGFWLPTQIDVRARGGFLFIKKRFAVHEDWYDYQINPGLADSLFLEQE